MDAEALSPLMAIVGFVVGALLGTFLYQLLSR